MFECQKEVKDIAEFRYLITLLDCVENFVVGPQQGVYLPIYKKEPQVFMRLKEDVLLAPVVLILQLSSQLTPSFTEVLRKSPFSSKVSISLTNGHCRQES